MVDNTNTIQSQYYTRNDAYFSYYTIKHLIAGHSCHTVHKNTLVNTGIMNVTLSCTGMLKTNSDD